MEKRRAEELLETGYNADRKPIAVHGTCVEAAVQLLKTGVLPSSYNMDRRRTHPHHRGYLYFFPWKDAFRDRPEIYEKIMNNRYIDFRLPDELDLHADHYAALKQRIVYLRELFGKAWPKNLYLNPEYEEAVEVATVWLISLDKPRGTTPYSRYRIKGILQRELEEKKGVVIALNEKALELEIKPGSDDPEEEIMIHLPDGLDQKYVLYVKAFGEQEKRKLGNFARSL